MLGLDWLREEEGAIDLVRGVLHVRNHERDTVPFPTRPVNGGTPVPLKVQEHQHNFQRTEAAQNAFKTTKELPFTIKHCPGKEDKLAGTLSRHPQEGDLGELDDQKRPRIADVARPRQ